MIRSFFIAPAAVLVTGGVILAFCGAAGWAIAPGAVILPAVVAVMAATVALLPLAWLHGSPADVTIQASLAGTVLHMMLFLILSAGAWGAGLIQKVDAYAICLMIFYCVSIVPVATVMIRAIRSASPPSTSPQPRAP